jgi:ABC-type transporter Mla subunit MlaD
MAGQKSSGEDLFAKGVGVAIAVGALAAGLAAALMNQERARQIRADVQTQLDELGRRVDDLSAQAARVVQEKRPDIENTISKSRQAVVDGLEKARTVVEQGAEKAQEYVHKASQQASSAADNAADTVSAAVDDVADDARMAADNFDPGAETRDLNISGNGSSDGPH